MLFYAIGTRRQRVLLLRSECRLSLVEGKADLERHLVARDLSVGYVAPHLGHLEPPMFRVVAEALAIAFSIASVTLSDEVPTRSTSL
jgi:hypothetical protein